WMTRCPATPPWRRTSTSATATWQPRRGSTPRRPRRHPTWPSAITSRARPPGSPPAGVAERSAREPERCVGGRRARLFAAVAASLRRGGSGGREAGAGALSLLDRDDLGQAVAPLPVRRRGRGLRRSPGPADLETVRRAPSEAGVEQGVQGDAEAE